MNGIPEETGVLLFTNISSDIDKFKRWQNIIINCGPVAERQGLFCRPHSCYLPEQHYRSPGFVLTVAARQGLSWFCESLCHPQKDLHIFFLRTLCPNPQAGMKLRIKFAGHKDL